MDTFNHVINSNGLIFLNANDYNFLVSIYLGHCNTSFQNVHIVRKEIYYFLIRNSGIERIRIQKYPKSQHKSRKLIENTFFIKTNGLVLLGNFNTIIFICLLSF